MPDKKFNCHTIKPSYDDALRTCFWQLLIVFAIAISLSFSALVTSSTAAEYSEGDFLRQSRICEVAARTPWGDVASHAWSDCLAHRRLRTADERESDQKPLNNSWVSSLKKSRLDATEEGCEELAKRQPSNPPTMRGPGVWSGDRAWNICMEHEGIFASPTLQRREFPNFRKMATERRLLKVTETSAACASINELDRIEDEAARKMKFGSWGEGTKGSREDVEAKRRELVHASRECRFIEKGETVRLNDENGDNVCVKTQQSDNCFWIAKSSINPWE